MKKYATRTPRSSLPTWMKHNGQQISTTGEKKKKKKTWWVSCSLSRWPFLPSYKYCKNQQRRAEEKGKSSKRPFHGRDFLSTISNMDHLLIKPRVFVQAHTLFDFAFGVTPAESNLSRPLYRPHPFSGRSGAPCRTTTINQLLRRQPT